MSVSHNTIQSYNISMSMVKTRVKVLYFNAQSSTNQNYSSYKLVFKKIRYRDWWWKFATAFFGS